MSRYVTEVRCLKVDKKTRRNKALMFTLCVAWSDGIKDEALQRPYVSIFDFHAKLKETVKDDSGVTMPALPAAKKFGRSFLREISFEKKKTLIEDYFQKVLQLPPCMSRGETVREFFEFVWSPEGSEAAPVESTPNLQPLTIDLGQYETIDHFTSVRDTAHTTPTSQSQGQPQGQGQSEGEGQSQSPTEVMSNNATGAAVTSADSEAFESIYLAVQSYKKRKSGEVDLLQGSTVGVMQRELSGWWFVHVQETDEEGWAPASCLLPEDRSLLVDVPVTDGPVGEFQTRCDYESIADDELTIRKDQRVQVIEARLDGWWKVKRGDDVGLTPATLLEPVSSDTARSSQAVYHHIGLYRKLSPPPRRRDAKETIDELYAKVNKKEVRHTNSVSVTPVVPTDATECEYSQIEPTPAPLSAEDYRASEEANNGPATPKGLRHHSYVNVPSSHSGNKASPPVEQQPSALQSGDKPLEQKSAEQFPTVRIKPTSSDDKQQSVTSLNEQPPADRTSRNTTSFTAVPLTANKNRVSLPKTSAQQPSKVMTTRAGEQLQVQKIDRERCEQLLTVHGKPHQYMLRESTKAGCPYALSVLSSDRVHHIPIELTVDNKFYIGQYSFESVAKVVDHYSQSALCYTDDGKEVLLGSQFLPSDSATTQLPSTR